MQQMASIKEEESCAQTHVPFFFTQNWPFYVTFWFEGLAEIICFKTEGSNGVRKQNRDEEA